VKNIELQTTQNVLINYELASLRDRVLAFIIDVVAIAGITTVASFAMTFAVSQWQTLQMIGFTLLGLFVTFYTLLFEALNQGQTLGKMAMRIQVTRLDGDQPNFIDYVLRWVFRLLDIWFSFGAFAVVLISSTPRAQRIGDLVSNMVVVRASPQMTVALKDVLAIDTSADHHPVYPAVRQFRESDMLVIKQALDRYHRFGNTAHREALAEAASHTAKLLEVDPVPTDHEGFLRTLVKDYIVLTR
jgi:uncharacterized RDD family membrane protein YckC